ncbi:MAG: Flp pilus assembly protein CpaB [Dehalococcoidia bacterium]|nr:Flp pilus assembly protein CpaB [Dehalococcoidia bacterium]
MSRITRLVGRRNVPILLALLLGGATFIGALAWLPTLSDGDTTPTVETRSVLVARDDLSAGERLDRSRLALVEVPTDVIATGALTRIEDGEGQVLRYPVEAGEQILASKFVGAERAEATGLAFVVPEGMRAVSVPVTEVTGAGGLIVAGDRVDVLAAVSETLLVGADYPTEGPEADIARREAPTAIVTVLQNALVLAVGQSVSDTSSVSRDDGAQRADDATPDPKAVSVTLAVSPEDAQALFMAVTEGSIGLALRSFGDTSSATVAPIVDVAPADDQPKVSAR